MYIHRDIEPLLSQFIGTKKQAVAIVGPRQAGKTTLLQFFHTRIKRGRKTAFLTFEKLDDRRLFSDNIEGFKKLYDDYDVVFIDEFQYATEGGQKLKYLFDTTKTQYVLSGSSSLDLMFQTGKYMVGRLITVKLLPLSFHEYLNVADKAIARVYPNTSKTFLHVNTETLGPVLDDRMRKHFESYLIFGGFPRVSLADTDEERITQLKALYDTYILRDVESLLRLATERELQLLIKALALQVGNLIEYRELAQVSGLTDTLVKKHIALLAQTYILDLLTPYFTNRRTELVKNPKVYFWDSGFRNLIVSDFRDLSLRQDTGALVENYIFCRLSEYAKANEEAHFWRTKNKAEVDFVFVRGDDVTPFEVKYARRPVIGKSLHSFIQKFSPHDAYVLTRETFARERIGQTTIYFVPVYYL